MSSDADLLTAVARRELTPEAAAEEMMRRDRRSRWPSLFALAMALVPAAVAACIFAGVADPMSPRTLSACVLLLGATEWIKHVTGWMGGRR